MYINASNETNHLQKCYTHYNTIHTHICTGTFKTGPYLLVPVFVEFYCTASRYFVWAWVYRGFTWTLLEHPPPLMIYQWLDIHNTEIIYRLKHSSQNVVYNRQVYAHITYNNTKVTSLVASGISDEIQDTAACLSTFNSSHCQEPEYVSDMLIHRTIHDNKHRLT
jgi:hypothetical protein